MTSGRISRSLAIFGLVMSAASLVAQGNVNGEVRGRILRVTDTLAIVAGVDLELLPLMRRTRADDNGKYVLSNVPPGEYELRARHLGFERAARRVIVVEGAELTEADVMMRESAQPLKEVVIEGRRTRVPPRFEAVYDRAARGWGKLFTGEDIRERSPSDLKSLLATLPGVQVNDRGVTFQRCQADLNNISVALSGRTSGDQIGASRRPGNVQVYVDGHRLTFATNDPNAEADAERVLSRISPVEVEAMEVYTGVARLPPEFMSDACAAIVIWTRAY